MDVEMERFIDEVWDSSLKRISKKELCQTRPSLGEEVDLYVPQMRTLLLLRANPNIASLIYNSAYVAASRNAYVIMRKLGMPADYFWKFDYWPRKRAFDTLQRLINRVFTAMMNENKEGQLELEDVDVERMRFTLSFKDCVECAGISAERGLCYYHAATFSGIIAALINNDMDGYEIACHLTGDDACTFLIGLRDDPEISAKVNNYLAPANIEIKIDDRLNSCLCGQTLRSMGNLVNIGYYQLMVTNSIITNPALFSSSSFDVGVEYGLRLASILTEFYQERNLEVIKKYYSQLRHLDVRMIEAGADIDIVLAECAELTTIMPKMEFFGFLFGELQGIASRLVNKTMVYKESWFEDGELKVRLSPKV